eukprot:TRINITY_DN20332_c0_g1_i1.p1 TRINITY_DN20332_c0_g1~~TRINITY_DN20332_c0_g1_i1.p1  ORF type:complete len:539 (+),score=154.05 TRINITY_DN20332_c0_g1_i1:113-1618(+)
MPTALMEYLPEVTLEDAVLKIRDLKAELAHVREVQQGKIDKLTRQLAMLETFHLEDRKKMMASMRDREALLLEGTDPARMVKTEVVDELKKDHRAELHVLKLHHKAEVRGLQEKLDEERGKSQKLAADAVLHRERAEQCAGELKALEKARDGQQRLGGDTQGGGLWLELLQEVRRAYGAQAVDAVVLRTLKTSSRVKQLDVDVLGLLGESLAGLDLRRAEASYFHQPQPVEESLQAISRPRGVASPGRDASPPFRNACIAAPPAAAAQRKGEAWLARAHDLHKAADDLRRSRSHESARWSRSPHLNLQAPPMSPVGMSPRSAASRSPVARRRTAGRLSPSPAKAVHSQPWSSHFTKSPPTRGRGRREVVSPPTGGRGRRDIVSPRTPKTQPWAEDWAEYWAGWRSQPASERGKNARPKTPLNLHPQRPRSTGARRGAAPHSDLTKRRSESAPQRPYAQTWMPPAERERFTGRSPGSSRPASPAARAVFSRQTPVRSPWPLC